jgi:HK97 family phage major capsid protein
MRFTVTSSLDDGTDVGQVPCVFANIEAGYAVMIKKDPQLITIQDTEQAFRGLVGFLFDAYMDGAVYNPDALAKLTITT